MASKSQTNLNTLTDSLLASLEQSRARQLKIVAENRVDAAKQYRERGRLNHSSESKKAIETQKEKTNAVVPRGRKTWKQPRV